MQHTTHSTEETLALGKTFAKQLRPNSIVCFFGDLGAGKTTLIKGIVSELTGCDPEDVLSPTFVYLNIYEGQTSVYHFDLYRLKEAKEFVALGFEEYLCAGGVCCIEWSERIATLLPEGCFRIEMHHVAEEVRTIDIRPFA